MFLRIKNRIFNLDQIEEIELGAGEITLMFQPSGKKAKYGPDSENILTEEELEMLRNVLVNMRDCYVLQ